jgi:hypothetical protein
MVTSKTFGRVMDVAGADGRRSHQAPAAATAMAASATASHDCRALEARRSAGGGEGGLWRRWLMAWHAAEQRKTKEILAAGSDGVNFDGRKWPVLAISWRRIRSD